MLAVAPEATARVGEPWDDVIGGDARELFQLGRRRNTQAAYFGIEGLDGLIFGRAISFDRPRERSVNARQLSALQAALGLQLDGVHAGESSAWKPDQLHGHTRVRTLGSAHK